MTDSPHLHLTTRKIWKTKLTESPKRRFFVNLNMKQKLQKANIPSLVDNTAVNVILTHGSCQVE